MTEKFSPAVSVIVPVFNAEKYLPDCLESILAQTFADFEVIVVDDASTDASLTVAENFRARGRAVESHFTADEHGKSFRAAKCRA